MVSNPTPVPESSLRTGDRQCQHSEQAIVVFFADDVLDGGSVLRIPTELAIPPDPVWQECPRTGSCPPRAPSWTQGTRSGHPPSLPELIGNRGLPVLSGELGTDRRGRGCR